MKYFLLTLLCILQTLALFGQTPGIDKQAIAKIRDEGLNRSQIEELTYFLTDYSGPRLSNSEGYQRAAQWAVAQLSEWGLKEAHLEAWGDFGRGWQVEKTYTAMKAPYYFPLIAMPKAWSHSTNGLITGEVVVLQADNAEELDQYRGKLAGKVILFPSDDTSAPTFKPDATRKSDEEMAKIAAPPVKKENRYTAEQIAQYWAKRALQEKLDTFLIQEKALGILRGTRGRHGTFFTSNGGSYATDAPWRLPEWEMAPEHANLMARLIAKGEKVVVEAEAQTRFIEDTKAYNVIAEIPGSDKKLKPELVMLGAHLDSWHAATGATDNAAGCIVMMEAVRILQACELKPKRTIRIALWSGEEQGLYGSRHYVKKHFADQNDMQLTPEHENFSAYYNLDNGGGRIRGIYLQENAAAKPYFEAWLAPFSDLIETPTITLQNTGATDHISFDAVGLPAFQFIQDNLEYGTRTHHSNMDLRERLIMDDLKQMAVIVASIVYHTAQAEDKIPRKALPAPAPSPYE
ncbi:M20/M25/M40 family metallo-hydrolase [Cytophagales bacterium LB-30]|uniref:Carboxypeptidase Q n=1 Tax=Shiella aurantiaca TaxID=3058365 RepID=A0ABT8F6J8_9BACT|nr:M20/M25/M40 family metallo-hydrolase [Shiella aurantiaca]MDN4165998.1 M20/M25/M40 family metallo-hydrolase [Shiella aurantiaca]